MRSLTIVSRSNKLIAAATCLWLCGAVGCEIWNRNDGFLSQSADVGSGRYEAIWDMRSEPPQLIHIFLIPDGATLISFATAGLGRQPLKKGVSSLPDGLYLDGNVIPTGEGRRVFVWTKERKLRPIPLTKQELKALSPTAIKNLENTEVWKNKIKPVLDEEDWRKPTDQ